MNGKAITSTYRRYERLVIGSQTADYVLPWVTDHRTSRNNQKKYHEFIPISLWRDVSFLK
jgi:hypothetical protein